MNPIKPAMLVGAVALQRRQLAGSFVNVIPLDITKIRGQHRNKAFFARCLAGLLRALDDSGRRQGDRVFRRYRHLICVSDTPGGQHSDGVSGRK